MQLVNQLRVLLNILKVAWWPGKAFCCQLLLNSRDFRIQCIFHRSDGTFLDSKLLPKSKVLACVWNWTHFTQHFYLTDSVAAWSIAKQYGAQMDSKSLHSIVDCRESFASEICWPKKKHRWLFHKIRRRHVILRVRDNFVTNVLFFDN